MQYNNESKPESNLLQHTKTSDTPSPKYEDLKLVLILFAIFYGTMLSVLLITLLIRQICNCVGKKRKFIPPRPNYLRPVNGFDETDAITKEPAKQCHNDQDFAIELLSVK